MANFTLPTGIAAHVAGETGAHVGCDSVRRGLVVYTTVYPTLAPQLPLPCPPVEYCAVTS